MLAVDRLSVTFPGGSRRERSVAAVDDVSFEHPDGEVLAVLGPSGCGKSTLLRAVAGVERPGRGRVGWDGEDLTRTPAHRRGFALMFQDGQLFGHLSVADNVGYALRLRRRPRAERRAVVAELLELVGLPGYADRLPATLSGGERQRVALARALAGGPRLLLLDEPLSALDRDLRERLAGDLREILLARRTTALVVTHDHDEAFALADRLAVMRAGRFVQHGTVEEVWRRPVDADTARFLGYASVVRGAAAARLLGAARAPYPGGGPAVALRRSALTVDPGGPLEAVVTSLRTTPERLRLTVEVSGVGPADAVASLDSSVRVGDRVRLVLDHTRTAVLP